MLAEGLKERPSAWVSRFMGLSDAIASAGLVVAAVAAWFAFQAWRHPKRPPRRTLPKFMGDAFEDAEKLVDFLDNNKGTVVYLHVEVGLTPMASATGECAFNENILTLNYSIESEPYWASFAVVSDDGSEHYLKRHTVSLVLEGAFVPTITGRYDAARMVGCLTHVGPVELAQYVS
jgi:hypothetical protein